MTADVDFIGEVVGSTIVIVDDGSRQILGITALESVGIEVDPRNQEMKRLQFVQCD